MRTRIRWAASAAILFALLAGCQKIEEVKHSAKATYTIEKNAKTGFSRMTLQAKAAERLALKTNTVRSVKTPNGVRTTIPYGALIYGTKGETWAYTSPATLVFLRQEISIDYIDGNTVFLSAGPSVGTVVVETGAAELYGLEKGFGK
jgi:hypothetical protein